MNGRWLTGWRLALIIVGATAVVAAGACSSDQDNPDRLEGQCIVLPPSGTDRYKKVGCDEPHDGKVVAIVGDSAECPAQSVPLLRFEDDGGGVKIACVVTPL